MTKRNEVENRLGPSCVKKPQGDRNSEAQLRERRCKLVFLSRRKFTWSSTLVILFIWIARRRTRWLQGRTMNDSTRAVNDESFERSSNLFDPVSTSGCPSVQFANDGPIFQNRRSRDVPINRTEKNLLHSSLLLATVEAVLAACRRHFKNMI